MAVTIVVVLAAVAGGYLFGLYDRHSVGPQVSFTYDYDGGTDTLTVRHEGGDEFDGKRVLFVCQSGSCTGYAPEDWSSNDAVSAGDEETIGGVSPDDTVLIVWEEPKPDGQTIVLDEWESPEAS